MDENASEKCCVSTSTTGMLQLLLLAYPSVIYLYQRFGTFTLPLNIIIEALLDDEFITDNQLFFTNFMEKVYLKTFFLGGGFVYYRLRELV